MLKRALDKVSPEFSTNKSINSWGLKLLAATLLIAACWQLSLGLQIHIKAWFAQALLERAWQHTLDGKQTLEEEQAMKPWPWADTWPVAELNVPKPDIEQIVLYGDNGRVLAFGPGHNEASAPAGEQGVTLLSGHRDTHFRFLEHLSLDDELIIVTSSTQVSYKVVERGIVDQREFSPQIAQNEDYLMLVTCYPFDALETGGDLRYVVVAKATGEGHLN